MYYQKTVSHDDTVDGNGTCQQNEREDDRFRTILSSSTTNRDIELELGWGKLDD